jgi:hypothetical protein
MERPVLSFKLPLQQQSRMYLALSKGTPIATVDRFREAISEMQQRGEIVEIVARFSSELSR